MYGLWFSGTLTSEGEKKKDLSKCLAELWSSGPLMSQVAVTSDAPVVQGQRY